MRIVVNNIAASTGGAMTILKSLYDYVVEHDKENQWIFLLNDKYFEETENIQIHSLPSVKKNWFNRLFFDMYTGKKYINKLKPDVYISLQNNLVQGINCHKIIYLHQVIPFQNHKKFRFFKKTERKLWIYQNIIGLLMKKSINQADLLVVQSEWLKKKITSLNLKKECEIVVIRPLYNNPMVIQSNVENEYNKKINFFYPASNEVYKNHEIIFKMLKKLDKKYKNEFELVLTLPENQCLDDNVKCVGELTHQETIQQMSTSYLLFPSYIESFGLPLIEARSLNRFIIAADLEYSREVLSGYENVKFFNPFDPDDLLNIIIDVIEKPPSIVKSKKQDEIDNQWSVLLSYINKYK